MSFSCFGFKAQDIFRKPYIFSVVINLFKTSFHACKIVYAEVAEVFYSSWIQMHFHSGKKLWFSPKRVSAKKKKKNHSFNHKPNRRSQAGHVERKRLFHQDADQPENRMHYTVLILTQNKPRSLLTRCFSTLIAFCSVSPSEEALLSLLLNATA